MIGTEEHEGRAAGVSSGTEVVLWLCFLVPLAAWMVQLFALYMLEDFISCTPGSRTPGVILGLGVKPLALWITAFLGAVTVAAGVASFRLWRRFGGGKDAGDELSAPKWMALAGIMNSVLFTLIILIKAAPPFLLGVCQGAL